VSGDCSLTVAEERSSPKPPITENTSLPSLLGAIAEQLLLPFDASVDVTDARYIKVKEIDFVRPPACRAGSKCRPT
jgi:hypothetical protein